MKMKIAIVDAEESKWTEEQKVKAKQKFREILIQHLSKIRGLYKLD